MGYAGNRVRLSVSLLLFFCLIILSPVHAASEGPSAEPFSDPDYIVDMQSGWDGNPIRYKDGDEGADLSIVVNQQLSAVLLPIVDRFASQRKVKIAVQIGTCGISAGNLSRKEVDMGGFCCPPGKVDRLPGLEFHTLGITPLLMLVHKDVGVDNVTLEQARALYRGEIHKWSELGGADIPVRPMGMLHCKKRPGHWRLILGSDKLFSPEFKVTGDIEDTINTVASTPGAIGFEIMMNILKLGREGDLKVLNIDGHDPMDLERLKAHKYPFYRVMNITTWKGQSVSNPLAVNLMSFMMEETARVDPAQGILPVAELRKAGWEFSGGELTGEPR